MTKFLFRILPIYYSFLSGVFVSVAANLFTGVFGSDSPPAKINIVLLSAGLALLSSLLWIVFAMIADDARNTVASFVKSGLDVSGARAAVADSLGRRAALCFLSAVGVAVLSLIVLVGQPAEAHKEAATQRSTLRRTNVDVVSNAVTQLADTKSGVSTSSADLRRYSRPGTTSHRIATGL